MIKRILLLLLAFCLVALPQSVMPPTGTSFQITPQAVPTSITVVTSKDSYLRTFTITNPTAGAITFTLADRQSSPVSVLGAVSIAANTTYVIVWPQYYWCPKGFTVTSSGAGLTMYGGWNQ